MREVEVDMSKTKLSARRPLKLEILEVLSSKAKQFCETSSIFELDNIKNETCLRDFLNF